MDRPSLPDRIYRALLELFPREFRGDFGDQMADDFCDQREDAASRTAAFRLWVRTVVDVLRRAPAEHLDILRRDTGYALRLFRRRPGMTASALLTLAVGVGLNAAVFSIVHAVLWRSLPVPGSERLVNLSEVSPAPDLELTNVSPANVLDWQKQAHTLDALATINWQPVTIVQQGGAERIEGAGVSADFFRIVPARVVLGRLLNASDYAPLDAQLAARDPNAPRQALLPGVAVIGFDLWQRQFGGRPDVIGQKVPFGRSGTVEIVGVLEKDFVFPLAPDAESWLPVVLEPDQRRARYLQAIGRLASGTAVEEAQSEFDVIAARLATAYPNANKGRAVRVTTLRAHVAAGVRTQLLFLGGTVICVLLIACLNVSNLLLTHTSGRRRELATRVALGASRPQLVRQVLTEGLLLAGLGGVIGFLLAIWTVPWLVARAPATIPRLHEVTVGPIVLAFALGVSAVVGVLSAAGASVAAGRKDMDLSLRTAGTTASSQGHRLRRVLIIGEVALASMLAIAATLLVQTVRTVTALPLGFDSSNVISVGLSPDVQKVGEGFGGKAKFEREMIDAVRSLPGVVAAGIGSRPLGGGSMGTSITLPAGSGDRLRIDVDAVGPGYLDALGARLAAGRFIDERDTASGPPVALVNEAAANRYFDGTPVGRTVMDGKREITIVGVLRNVRRTALEEEARPTLYLPSAQTSTFWTNNMLVRTTGDPRELLPAIRTVVRRIDPELPLTRIQTLDERLSEATAPRRFNVWLVGIFSVIALGLAVIGIYGVVNESVAQRVPEIGVRIALGATGTAVMRMILREGSWLIACGVLLGVTAALAFNDVMSSFVFGVETTDTLAYTLAVALLTAATLGACAIPARRASHVDPLIALRCE